MKKELSDKVVTNMKPTKVFFALMTLFAFASFGIASFIFPKIYEFFYSLVVNWNGEKTRDSLLGLFVLQFVTTGLLVCGLESVLNFMSEKKNLNIPKLIKIYIYVWIVILSFPGIIFWAVIGTIIYGINLLCKKISSIKMFKEIS